MIKINKVKIYTLEKLTDKYIGKRGTDKRENFETKLKLKLLDEAIKSDKISK